MSITERIIMDLIIECNGIFKEYSKGKDVKKVLKGLDFAMKKGEIQGILGLNGSGKTTMVRLLSGILRQDSGDLRIFGHTYDRQESLIKKMLGVVVGGDRSLYYKLTAKENLYFFGRLYGIKKKELNTLIDRNLERVNLIHVKDDLVETYSRGMKQRLLIAKALISNPKLLILDEPTSGLDISSQFEVRSLIKELNIEKSLSVLLFTHNLSEADELCTKLNILHNGKLINTTKDKKIIKDSKFNKKITIITEKRQSDFCNMKNEELLLREESRHQKGYQYIFYSEGLNVEEHMKETFLDKKDIISIQKENLQLEDYLYIKFKGLEE